MRIIIMGPPGVGKGTQANKLEAELDIPHVSTGDIFRALFRTDDPIGIEAREYMDKGMFVPDDLTNKIVQTRFREDDVKEGFLFDGYPRNVAQAKAFDKFLEENNWEVDIVLNIESPEEVIIKRLSGRRVCPKCGATYHVDSNPPKVAGVCDNDQTKLIQREDDKIDTVKNRIAIYNSETKPLIKYYEKQGLVANVDGNQAIEKTYKAALKAIGENK